MSLDVDYSHAGMDHNDPNMIRGTGIRLQCRDKSCIDIRWVAKSSSTASREDEAKVGATLHHRDSPSSPAIPHPLLQPTSQFDTLLLSAWCMHSQTAICCYYATACSVDEADRSAVTTAA